MSDFISEIRKIPTCDIIRMLSDLSIVMFISGESSMPLKLLCNLNGVRKHVNIPLLAWDIPSIEYLSVKYSNDHRNSRKKLQLEQLVNCYRGYENDQTAFLDNADANTIFRSILGMTSEQFLYQELWRSFEKFNRDYHILLAAKGYRHKEGLDINTITHATFGLSADDYIAVLLIVFWLCSQHPDPLNVPENLYRKKDATVLKKENIAKFVEYYSCTYEELRESALGKQLLYSKPFIKTSNGAYLSSSLFLVEMIIGNGLYWLARDYYFKQNSYYFVNAFGEIFEDYIDELASQYMQTGKWQKIPEGDEKSADYLFDFQSLKMLIECKASLLALDAKQQIPNIDNLNKYFEHTIRESYEQLNSSYSKLASSSEVPIIKVILLYDEFSNTGIIETSMPEIFDHDHLCYVMTISEFEVLLYTYKHNQTKHGQIISQILQNNKQEQNQSIGSILNNLYLYNNNGHFEGSMNYFSKLLDHFGI